MYNDAFFVRKISRTSKGGYKIERGTKIQSLQYTTGRGVVTEFSPQSRQRLAWYASQADCDWMSMITLTYGQFFPNDGASVKRDLNRFLTLLRKKVSGITYLWFLEFQSRNAPHVHILLNIPYIAALSDILFESWVNTCMGYVPDYAVRSQRYKLAWFNGQKRPVTHGGIEVYQDAKFPGGLARYAVKYALKMSQKVCPAQFLGVGRFWGCSRNIVKTEELGADINGYSDLQSVVTQILDDKDIADKYPNFDAWVKYIY